MIRKFHEAKIREDPSVSLFGNGFPIRDFCYVDDAAEGIVLALEKHHSETPINISSGKGVSILETANIIKDVVGFKGDICWDLSKPNGQQVKVFDCERAEKILGFKPKVSLEEGIKRTVDWYIKTQITS
jgi:GDP-L-fucose synthase